MFYISIKQLFHHLKQVQFPSIFCLWALILHWATGGWDWFQLTLSEIPGPLRWIPSSSRGHCHGDKQTLTLTFTLIENSKSPINLTWLIRLRLDTWGEHACFTQKPRASVDHCSTVSALSFINGIQLSCTCLDDVINIRQRSVYDTSVLSIDIQRYVGELRASCRALICVWINTAKHPPCYFCTCPIHKIL